MIKQALVALIALLVVGTATAGECYGTAGIGYDFKDGGSFLSGGKYDGLSDSWRWHGHFGAGCSFDISSALTLPAGSLEIGPQYRHYSSLYDGFSGSPRDSDIILGEIRYNFLRW